MIFELVENFNREIIDTKRDQIEPLEENEFKWLMGTLREEIQECEEAKTTIDQIDAILDLIYFACGGLTRMGLSHEQSSHIFKIVHDANMRKAKGKKKGRVIESDLDAIKPDDWEPPEKSMQEYLGL